MVATVAEIPSIASLPPDDRSQQVSMGPSTCDGVLLQHGDYGTNPGPIDILALAPDGTITTLLPQFDTEEIDRFYVLEDGCVWTPAIDSHSNINGAIATNSPTGVDWRTIVVHMPGYNPTHLFGVDLFGGRNFTCGSRPGPGFEGYAMVLSSSNGGATWVEELIRDDDRFTEFCRIGGQLAVTNTAHSAYYVRQDDASWELVPGAMPDAPRGRRVYIDSQARLVDTDHGIVRALSTPAAKWSVTLDPDGYYWLSDQTSIYRFPVPD